MSVLLPGLALDRLILCIPVGAETMLRTVFRSKGRGPRELHLG